ncbi:MAG: hypothetical protein AAF513_08960 [Pseudomonadota bacterium]
MFAGCGAVILWGYLYGRRQRGREALIRAHRFTADVPAALVERYGHLSEADVERVLDGLRTYIVLCLGAGKRTLAMPSQAVDVAWHAFILNTGAYAQFCDQALGRFLHHIPSEAMAGKAEAQDSIKRTWSLACKDADIDPLEPDALPNLFALDAELKIEDGFHYSLDCEAQGEQRFCATHINCGGGCAGSPVYAVDVAD